MNYAGGKSPKLLVVQGLEKPCVARSVSIQAIFSTVSTELVPELVHRAQRYLMTTADLPHLTIEAIEPDCWTGHYDPSKWVGDGWIGGIYVDGSRFIWGRFRNVDATGHTCSFC